MTRRHERPLMSEEREAVRRLARSGMSVAAIATALFVTKRQVAYTLEHPDDNEAVRVGEA